MSHTVDFLADDNVRRALAPSNGEIREMPRTTNREIAGTLLARKGKCVLDIGCGDGKFTGVLATLFERVEGLDVNERKIEAAQKAADAAGLAIKFRAGSGEALPHPDRSIDVVVFSNSLHHMADMDGALREAARVLVPGGLIYVMEPVAAGNYFEATRLVNDETVVRTDAYRAIGRVLQNHFVPVAEIIYRARREFADFAEWRDDQIERSASRRVVFETRGEEARRRFEQHADRQDGRLAFDQIFRVNLLSKI